MAHFNVGNWFSQHDVFKKRYCVHTNLYQVVLLKILNADTRMMRGPQ